MNRFTLSLSLLLCFASSKTIAQTIQQSALKRGFVSWQPAQTWEHALISGNGTMGALVMGQPHEETIILSQADLYLPLNEPKQPLNQASRLAEIRKLLLEGKAEAAAAIPMDQRKKDGFNIGRDPFIPAFDLHVSQEPANISKYQRSVNFETGEAIVSWTDDLGSFDRKLFVSRADSIIVLSITGTGKINTTLDFDKRPVQWDQWNFVKSGVAEMAGTAEEGFLTFQCKFKNQFERGLQGYEGLGRLILKGGKSELQGNKIKISNADEVMLLIQINPSKDWKHSAIPAMKAKLNSINAPYETLNDRHAGIHGKLFNRSKLSLNGTAADRHLNTEELLLKAKTEVPAALIEKVYDAGRYNIISAMGSNPPNLQGIWSGTWTAPWSGDFTHDGNLPAAVSSVHSSNMPELADAYFHYFEEKMPTYRENAKRLFGTNGIHIPAHSSNNGLDTDFSETWCLTYWTGAAGWVADFFYDHFQYTQNREFLQSRAYPIMKEAAQFYEEFLTVGADGKYVFNPSYSPENNPANSKSQAVINATMDVMIASQLLNNCIAAANTLGIDAQKVKMWNEMLRKMPEYQVAKDGTFREWLWPGAEENMSHRHVSQLYSLYNKADSAIVGDEKLLAAVNKTIDGKLAFRKAEGGGEMAFGLVQIGLSAAHIREAEKAKAAVDYLASKYWSTALGSFHNVGDLFNTDISGGLPAVILEMLVYSEQDQISLLPALPKDWNKGKLEGALLRGNVTLKKLEWDSKQIRLTLNAKTKRTTRLVFPAAVQQLLINGASINLNRIKGNSFPLNLSQGSDVNLEITLK
jgi:alpha-L-fucosidase 2